MDDITIITTTGAATADLTTRAFEALCASGADVRPVDDAQAALAEVVALLPDVFVLDAASVPAGSLDVIARWVHEVAPATRTVLLAPDGPVAVDALRHGVFAVVAPGATSDTLRAAVRGAARGESTLPPGVARALLDDMRATTDALGRRRLTAIEHEILRRLADGDDVDDIADDHDVTPRLVHLHVGYAVAKRHQVTVERERLAGVDTRGAATGDGHDVRVPAS